MIPFLAECQVAWKRSWVPVTDLVLHLALVIATPGVLHSEQPTGKNLVPTTRGGAVNYGSSCFKQGEGGGARASWEDLHEASLQEQCLQ